ncbi:methyl-accepting chemotaxis protein [Paenibacillus doosanensis]|uniref:methyl-accepting chemotaxis protein n=1 Tax=Paenibacillus doosanensis TaxID=1229154 RepID=UPI00217FA319|nr:methyl-accepting chemotaxis protein [Paenibacillus doosanensis]MCS7461741.1 methyl-accepting chemotaxis protein [Paenibacillus doosanensis]
MKWFHNLNIAVKFVGCFAAILIILMIGNGMGLLNAGNMNNNLVNLYENDLKTIKQLGEISSSFHLVNASVSSYVLLNSSDTRANAKETIAAQQQIIKDRMASIAGSPITEQEQKELELVKLLWSTYPPSIEKVLQLADQNQTEFAKSVLEKELLTKQDGIDRTIQGFIELNQQKADTRYSASLGQYQSIKWSTIIILAVSLLLSAIVGTIMTFSMLKPINRLLAAFRSMESGDLSKKAEINRRDELGQLAAGFENMRQSVASIVSQTKQSVGVLSAVARDIRQDALTTGEASQNIYGGLKEAAVMSDEQAARVSDDAVVIKEMSLGLKQVAAAIDNVSSLSSDMEKASDQGQKIVATALETMQTIQRKSEQTNAVVQTLSQHSQEIESVMITIKQIAEETNLLALNASIEAARAGEAGKGFAVVASEVRQLSENSKNAAGHVGSVIKRILESTQELARSSQASTAEMNEGYTKVSEVSAAFRQIFEWIRAMNDRVQDITATIEEMAAGSEQIDQSIKRIETYTVNFSSINQEYAEKSGQQAHLMDKVNDSAEELLNMSGELLALVNRFVTSDSEFQEHSANHDVAQAADDNQLDRHAISSEI